MGSVNQTEPFLLRLYSLEPGVNGFYTVGTPSTGWMSYPEGSEPTVGPVTLNRTGVGIYQVTLPRNYSRQEVSIKSWVDTDVNGTTFPTPPFITASVVALQNTLGGVLPIFNQIVVHTFRAVDGSSFSHFSLSFSLRMVRVRVATIAG